MCTASPLSVDVSFPPRNHILEALNPPNLHSPLGLRVPTNLLRRRPSHRRRSQIGLVRDLNSQRLMWRDITFDENLLRIYLRISMMRKAGQERGFWWLSIGSLKDGRRKRCSRTASEMPLDLSIPARMKRSLQLSRQQRRRNNFCVQSKVSKLTLLELRLTIYLYADNMHRFNSLPESVGYQSDNNSLGISTDDPLPTSSKPDPAPKATPRTSRFAAVSSSGRRMLSTRSAELSSPHLPPPVRPSLTILDRWAGVRHPSSPTTLIDTSLWRECLAWMLASTSCHHKSSPSPRAFLRRVDGMYSYQQKAAIN